MINTKLLAISLVAAFAVAVLVTSTATAAGVPGYLDIEKSNVKTFTDDDGETFLKAVIKTDERIPQFGAKGAIGYGFVFATDDDGKPENVLALTEHLCASDSFQQPNAPGFRCPDGVIGISILVPKDQWNHNEGSLFHAHNLDVSPVSGESACNDVEGATLEVDFARTTGTGKYPNVDVSPNWPVLTIGKTIIVGNVPLSEIGDGTNTDPALVVAFEIVPLADDSGEISNLCLTSVTPQGTA